MIDRKSIKVGDKIDAACELAGRKYVGEAVTGVNSAGVITDKYAFFFSEITAVNSPVKTYSGQFETSEGLTFDKMLDNLPF